MTSSTLVKAPQQRHGRGVSVVHRCNARRWGGDPRAAAYVKTQRGYFCRPLWRAGRKTPTLCREYRALLACGASGVPAPRVLSYRMDHDVAELVLEEISNARPLRTALQHAAAPLRARIMQRVAEVIGTLHNSGWVHGALGSAHILVEDTQHPRVWLIDFEKARRNPLKCSADLKRLWRRGDYFSASDKATFRDTYRRARNPRERKSL